MTATYDYQATRNEIISAALRIVGAISIGDPLTSDMESQGAEALNKMVKAWQKDGTFIWNYLVTTLALVASTATYATPTAPPIIGIESAFLSISGSDIPLKILSIGQYEEIYNKTATGQTTILCFNPVEPPTLIAWPVPSASGTVTYLAVTKQQDFDSSSDTGGFPADWNEAMTYNLAARLCDEYPIPLQERLYLAAKAGDMLKIAKKGNHERPTDDFVDGAF